MNIVLSRLSGLLILLSICCSQPLLAEMTDQQQKVAQRGAEIMPFCLAKTQHQFSKTKTGGVQRIVSRDSQDQVQILLIQQHLQQLSEMFTQGDYSDPEKIHGASMPGLSRLKSAKTGEIHILYQAEPKGASLVFTSKNPAMIKAIHQWFDAQVHDHGHDAMMMHHHE